MCSGVSGHTGRGDGRRGDGAGRSGEQELEHRAELAVDGTVSLLHPPSTFSMWINSDERESVSRMTFSSMAKWAGCAALLSSSRAVPRWASSYQLVMHHGHRARPGRCDQFGPPEVCRDICRVGHPVPSLAVGETVILRTPPLPLSGCFNTGEEGGGQQNDSLADGYPSWHAGLRRRCREGRCG